ncbi:MAG: NAD(P)/FAD-dependent oxidoreductase [Nanobdellota archaeon]
MYDITIIGAGVVGLAGAMYSGRFNAKTLIIGEEIGGTITTTHLVENYPGFKSLSGQELADKLKEHAEDYDVDMRQERVEKIEKTDKGFRIKTTSNEYESKTVIYATGSRWKKLGLESEKRLANKGVSYCALCDGTFFRNKDVAVIGGSDSAAKDALVLSEIARKVYIIYRREKIRPEPINHKRIMEKVDEGKIEIVNNANVKEFLGDKILSGVKLDKEYNGSYELPLQGAFVAIGHVPLTGIAEDLGVEVNGKKEIVINRNAETNIPGFFAAGDCVDTVFKQAITGVGEAVLASYSAFEFVKKSEVEGK